MTQAFVVIVEPRTGQPGCVHGPYPTAARASGAGFSKYGPIVFGGTRWTVRPLEET